MYVEPLFFPLKPTIFLISARWDGSGGHSEGFSIESFQVGTLGLVCAIINELGGGGVCFNKDDEGTSELAIGLNMAGIANTVGIVITAGDEVSNGSLFFRTPGVFEDGVFEVGG